MRDKKKDLRAVEEHEAKSKSEVKIRTLLLSSLCDVLRSKCLEANRTRIKTSELMQHLVSELSLTKEELLLRLHVLADVVPDFLSLVPAGRIVPVSAVQLSLQALWGHA